MGTWLVLGLQRTDSNGLLVVTHVTLQRGPSVAAPSPQLGASSPPERSLQPSGKKDAAGEAPPAEQESSPPPACGVGELRVPVLVVMLLLVPSPQRLLDLCCVDV